MNRSLRRSGSEVDDRAMTPGLQPPPTHYSSLGHRTEPFQSRTDDTRRHNGDSASDRRGSCCCSCMALVHSVHGDGRMAAFAVPLPIRRPDRSHLSHLCVRVEHDRGELDGGAGAFGQPECACGCPRLPIDVRFCLAHFERSALPTRSSCSRYPNRGLVALAPYLWVSRLLSLGLLRLPTEATTLTYHLPMVDHWIQAGSLYIPDCSHWSVPGNNELLALWIVAPFRTDFLAPLNNVLPVVLFAAASVNLAREFGIRGLWSHLVGMAISCARA